MSDDVKTNETPLSESEKEQLAEIVQLNQQLQNAFGNLGIREVQLNAEKEALKVELGKKNQKETEITRKINEKYGVGQIDLQRGVFIASEQ
tara:strand:+ start:265 stop:537 length:273 start_codon:yes stop_codon:yes gene_type:complete